MSPDFEKQELIPAIVQDFFTKEVLMLAYMNEEAFNTTLDSGKVTFFSRSKNRIWVKGETSGNFLTLKSWELDCDRDTILIQAIPNGPACHLDNDTCFGTKLNQGNDLSFLTEIIEERIDNPEESSYTNELLQNLDKSAQKVGEEAVELIIEAKGNKPDRFLEESADLLYHYLVLLYAKDQNLHEVIEVLKKRMK